MCDGIAPNEVAPAHEVQAVVGVLGPQVPLVVDKQRVEVNPRHPLAAGNLLEGAVAVAHHLVAAVKQFPHSHRGVERHHRLQVDAGARAALLDDDDESGDNDRAQNVDELISKIAAYEENEEVEQPTLTGFLEEVALVADIDRIGEDNDRVLLMTLHSAKGLEFENVYLAGMEENVFPSFMTLQCEDSDPEGIEEERRLAYVGITRAKRHLTLTAARRRMVRGQTQYNRLSRFVTEIPSELLDSERPLTAASFLYDGGETIDDDYDSPFDDDDEGYDGHNSGYGKDSGGYSGIKSSIAKGLSKKSNSSFAINGKSQLASTYKLKASPKPKVTKPRAVPDKPYIAGAGATHTKGALAGLSKGMPMKTEAPDYKQGDRVSHVKYGVGTVTSLEQGPRDYKVTVQFDDCGQKIMYAAFAKLKKL